MSEQERRAAPRYQPPDGVTAEIGGVPVRLIDLSLVGAKVEHDERFPLATPQLTIRWHGHAAAVNVRVARSEIVGRRGEKLTYRTGIYFVDADAAAQGWIASLLQGAQPQPEPTMSLPAPPMESFDDTWIRKARLLRDESDDHLPYAQFRLTPSGWQKEYVASPEQPADGFTILRERHDFHELQRTFEFADGETRRMMQVALESQMAKSDR